MPVSEPYYSAVNRPLDDTTTGLRSHASMWFAFKGILTGALSGYTNGPNGAPPAASYWTIHSSSDGVTAGVGDNLGGVVFTAAKWVRAAAGVAHSWFVLQSPSLPGLTDGPFYVLVSFGTASDQNVVIAISKTAFSGGTITADPTAAGQSTYTTFQMHPNTTTNGKTHFLVDGRGSFWFFSSKNATGYAHACVAVQSLTETRPSNDVGRTVLLAQFTDSGRGAPNITQTTSLRGFHMDGTAATGANLNMAYLGVSSSNALVTNITQLNGADSKLDSVACCYVCSSLAGQMGIRGRIKDAWQVASGQNNGAGDPADTAPVRVVMGGLALPFNMVPGL